MPKTPMTLCHHTIKIVYKYFAIISISISPFPFPFPFPFACKQLPDGMAKISIIQIIKIEKSQRHKICIHSQNGRNGRWRA